jgi:O-antigen/teichoic acid export membrane protein
VVQTPSNKLIQAIRLLPHLRNVSILWVGTGLGALLTFVLQAFLARSLRPEAYGALAAAILGTSLLVPLGSMGTPQLWLQLRGGGSLTIEWVRATQHAIKVGVMTVCVAICAWSMSMSTSPISVVMLILSLHVVGQAFSEVLSSTLQLEGAIKRQAFYQVLPHVLRTTAVLALAVSGLTLTAVAIGYAVVGLVSTALGLQGIRKLSSMSTASGQAVSTVEALSRGWPFAAAGLLHLVYFQSGIVVVESWAAPGESGLFAVCFGMVAALYMVPAVVYQRYLLPALHLWAATDIVKFRKAFQLGTLVMTLFGLVVGFALWVSAPWLISVTFGKHYEAAAPVMRILALAMPLMFVSHSSGAALISRKSILFKVGIMAIAAATNVALGVFWAPKFGAVGGARAFLSAYGVLATGYTWAAVAATKESNNG